MSKLCAKDFTPYKGTLRCGQLSSRITLCPPPQPYIGRGDEKRIEISENIEIIGFLTTAELASPASHSRHLLLPLRSGLLSVRRNFGDQIYLVRGKIDYSSDSSELDTASVTESKGDLEEGEDVDSRTPNFCVLLHGAMKVTVFHG